MTIAETIFSDGMSFQSERTFSPFWCTAKNIKAPKTIYPMSQKSRTLLFLQRDAMCKHGHCCRPVSVCSSVTLVDCIQTAEGIVKLLTRPGSLIIPVFLTPSAGIQLQGEPLQQGCKTHGDGKILRFSTEIADYLGNGTSSAVHF